MAQKNLFATGRYAIKNVKTGKYFAGRGATGRQFPWVDSLEDAHKNWSYLEQVKDSIENILFWAIDVDGNKMLIEKEDLVIIDTVDNVVITDTDCQKTDGRFILY